MKTILYASLSANGHVLQADGDREIPAEVLSDFLAHARTSENVIIGRQTLDLMRAGSADAAFAGIDVVVLSRRTRDLPGGYVAGSPDEALRRVQDRGHTHALLAGGAAAFNSFLARDLVDELYLNITPVLSGTGIHLSTLDDRQADLQLLDVRRLGEDIVQLHHRIGRTI